MQDQGRPTPHFHDVANRFLIGYASAMLRDAGEELVAMHENVYGARYPASIRVDIAPWGGTFGAYSLLLDDGGFTVTMASRDAGYQGLAALEMLLHESSHAVVWLRGGRVAEAIAASAKRHGKPIPRDLWHAILFATTSRLTVEALARRGSSAYVPSAEDLLTRAWPQYRAPIESHWYPYLAGSGTLEEAIDKVVAAAK